MSSWLGIHNQKKDLKTVANKGGMLPILRKKLLSPVSAALAIIYGGPGTKLFGTIVYDHSNT